SLCAGGDAMLDVRLASSRGVPAAICVPVPSGEVAAALALLRDADRVEAEAFLEDVEHKGGAGTLHTLARPARRPARLRFVGIGDGDTAGWRGAGAALARGARKEAALTILLPADVGADAVGGLAEGLWLASYRFRLGMDDPEAAPKLRRVTLSTIGLDDEG